MVKHQMSDASVCYVQWSETVASSSERYVRERKRGGKEKIKINRTNKQTNKKRIRQQERVIDRGTEGKRCCILHSFV